MKPNLFTVISRPRGSILIHIIGWGIVFAFPLFFMEHTKNNPNYFTQYVRHFSMPLTFFIVFYLNYLLLIPRYLFKEKQKLFFVSNVTLLITMSLFMFVWNDVLMSIIDTSWVDNHPHPPVGLFYFNNVVSMIMMIGLSVAFRMSERWNESETARREAEKSRTEAELKNLRNQLNPHFLLNTLNNIYALIAFDTEKAQKVVEELSKLLRYVLYDNQQTLVPLCKEADFMRNYVELMKIRVTDNVKIDINIDINPDDSTKIAPLIFISLIENAFKHGISPSEPSYIGINVNKNDGNIICEIHNSNFPKSRNDKSGSGIGLEQVSKRLELTYPGRYTWKRQISPDGKEYSSKIIIYHDATLCDS